MRNDINLGFLDATYQKRHQSDGVVLESLVEYEIESHRGDIGNVEWQRS